MWDTLTKEMIIPTVSDACIVDGVVRQLDGLRDDHLIFLQYTGLKDCWGKEIYEGDILSEYSNNESYFFIEVIFKHGCFGYICSGKHFVELGRNKYYFDLVKDSEKSHSLEIIGNIYEDGDLLAKD